ncbi:hypothetical protein KPH14_003261 [Odynerus spinipes]|uniref:Poly(A) RNA polymerase, mitochondrial n=1 Tax=Odynerus spinipes TaxID=1348599 RepID=A0AAD9RGS8_9HYME|nr:hypothetical protein KPH14_003261 [Odynerus spinipes]
MAFYRGNINAPPLINYVYYKFNSNAFKLHLSRRQLSTKHNQLSFKRMKNASPSQEKNTTISNLSSYIERRKLEAQRSIIVQVATWKSCKDLLSYCCQFGDITSVFYYSLPKEHQFILLEYKQLAATKTALDAATYTGRDNIIPSRTNVMWFRKVAEKTSPILKQYSLPSISCTNYGVLGEAVIRNMLENAPSISSQMTILYNEYKIDELEIRLKFQVITNIEQYFSGIFPSIIVHPFGSFINGFGKKFSDLDIVLFADGLKKEKLSSKLVFHTKPTNINEKQQTYEFMGVLADTMRYMIPGISHVRRIFNARVPIIKFNNIFTYTECDLSMSNVIATYMTELLYLYGEIDDRVRPLVFTIRKWAHDNKLTNLNPGKTITNFSLTLLVIFYLQRQQILPVINNMKGFAEVRESVDNMDKIYSHSIYSMRQKQDNCEQLSSLLLHFFEFYSTFDFNEKEICLREGCTFPKTDNSALFIHNPFQKGLNVSKNVSTIEVGRLQFSMIRAISSLESTNSTKSKNWGILSIFDCQNSQNKVFQKVTLMIH